MMGRPLPPPDDSGASRRSADPRHATPSPFDLPTQATPASTSGFAAPDPLNLAPLDERYDILAEAGSGAMGQVFKARDRETGQVVALKLLKPEISSDQGMLDRFKSELLFARKITHKNVCRVYEFNRLGGIAFTSMEFVEGESLRSVLNRFGSVTLKKGTDLALQMCSGLKEAHAQGIVHRDLKPENVMIDTLGNLKIMDFGIAHSMESLTRLTGAMTGTPAYMAPEQAEGKQVDYRTDIYAFGLMLYEMFTGIQAFRAHTAVALALKQINEQPRPPRELEPSIPPALEDAILRCLEKDPARRFQSVAELESILRPSGVTETAAGSSSAKVFAPSGSTTISGLSEPGQRPARSTAAVLGTILGGVLAAALVGFGLWRGLAARPATAKTIARPAASEPVPVAARQAADAQPQAPLAAVPKATTPVPTAKAPKPQPRSVPAALGSMIAAPPPPPSVPQPSEEPASQARSGYILVGRFPREAGAQNAAKRLEGLGLPVTVRPRHNPANDLEFFVVLSGPYQEEKIDSTIEQMHAAGLKNARRARASEPEMP